MSVPIDTVRAAFPALAVCVGGRPRRPKRYTMRVLTEPIVGPMQRAGVPTE